MDRAGGLDAEEGPRVHSGAGAKRTGTQRPRGCSSATGSDAYVLQPPEEALDSLADYDRVTVSSPRLRTDAAKRFKKLPNAAAAIWKLLMVAEKALRRLNAPELLKGVYLDAVFEGTSAFLTRMVPVHSVRLEEGS